MTTLTLLNFLLPLICGVLCFTLRLNRKQLTISYIASCAVTFVLSFIVLFSKSSVIHLFDITSSISIDYNVDGVSKFFSILYSSLFLLISVYSVKYMDEEENENKFYGWYLLSLGMLISLSYSANLITMYMSFELVTLMSMPMVMHEKSKESIKAALKYLYYSIGGAFLGLMGLFFFYYYAKDTTLFTLGGFIDFDKVGEKNVLFGVVTLLSIIGFGAKAGMFPLHGWLPTAHPVAPSPASAALSGLIAKAGVLAIIRIIYFVVGTEYLKNTYIQYVFVSLALITILLGSFMACLQKNLKKRLAYSSVSQISYVLLGVAMMDEEAMCGAFLHIASHAVIKICLFLVAGAVIYYTKCRNVDDLKGIGKKMPVSMVCFTIASLGLVGIPPFGGFVSKWYLAIGSLHSGLTFLNVFAPVCLLISAILTAYYLLPIAINAFTHVNENDAVIKESKLMVIPLIILCVLIFAIGIFANPVVNYISSIF